jgi:hypothetical protein
MIFLFTVCGNAQKIVQLEKSGSLRTQRLYIGDEIVFKLKNDETGWYERVINDIDPIRKLIILHDVVIHVDSIDSVQLPAKAFLPVLFGGAFQVGGINLILFNLYYSIFRDQKLEWTSIAFGGINYLVGTLIRKIGRQKIFRTGVRKRIRLLDLNFNP